MAAPSSSQARSRSRLYFRFQSQMTQGAHARMALSRAFGAMISRSFRSCTSASARTETVDFRSLKGHHPCKRARPDWRSSFLCLHGFERCLGQSRILPSRRISASALCRRCPARLFQCAGPTLGQSRLQLKRTALDRLSLVHRPNAGALGPCRRNSPRSLS